MELHTYFDPARDRHEKDSMVEQNQWVFKLGKLYSECISS